MVLSRRQAVPEVGERRHAHRVLLPRERDAARDDVAATKEPLPEEEGLAQQLLQLPARAPQDARVEQVAASRPRGQRAQNLLKDVVREDQQRPAPSLLAGASLGRPCPGDGDHWSRRGVREFERLSSLPVIQPGSCGGDIIIWFEKQQLKGL